MNNRKLDESDILLDNIIKGIQDVKGKDITILDLRKIETSVCKHFVICSGSSNTQVSSISDSIRKLVSKDTGEKPWNTEELNTSDWILIDYSDIVVHVFQQKVRDFYNLEDLWGDADIRKIENL